MVLRFTSLAVLIGASLSAAPTYSVRVIPPPGGGPTGGNVINSSGLVAGVTVGTLQPFIGNPAGSQILPVSPFPGAQVYGMNDSGVVAGSSLDPALPFGYTASTVATVINSPLAGFLTSATNAINNAGLSVGNSNRSNMTPTGQATIWDGSGNPTPIAVPSNWTSSYGADINNLGDIVGGGVDNGVQFGFIGTSSAVTVVTLLGFLNTGVLNINDAGVNKASTKVT